MGKYIRDLNFLAEEKVLYNMPQIATQELNYEYYMETDVSEYNGEWIAVCDHKILSHSRNLKLVVKEAQEKCQYCSEEVYSLISLLCQSAC